MTDGRQKIAVIGGGVGAITATYAITSIPDWDRLYDITVYQLGWRLGGKASAGTRGITSGSKNTAHIWAGFYENAFRLMRDCYETMNRTGLRSPDAPLGTLDKAFSRACRTSCWPRTCRSRTARSAIPGGWISRRTPKCRGRGASCPRSLPISRCWSAAWPR